MKDKKKTTRSATSRIKVKVVQLAHGAGLSLPEYQTDGAAGLDLLAAVEEATPITLTPMQRAAIPTGLTFELPPGTEAQVRPRSGLALKQGLTVLNAPGTVDSDYRGEVQVILINLGQQDVVIRRGERIAQMIIAPVVQAKLKPRLSLTQTARGSGGFGSTGTSAIADENNKPKNTKKKKIVPEKAASKKRASKAHPAHTSRRAS